LPSGPRRCCRALRDRGGPGRKIGIPQSLAFRFGFEMSPFWGAGEPPDHAATEHQYSTIE
jgi:hypothetical protein